MKFRNLLLAAALAVPVLAVTAGAAQAVTAPGLGPWLPGPPASAFIATTRITDDPDGGYGTPSNWASDTISRTVSVSPAVRVSGTDCGLAATAGCWAYLASLNDNGTFVTIPHAGTPNQSCAGCAGKKIKAPAVRGTLHGVYSIAFYASSASPDAALVPAAHNDGGFPGAGKFTSTMWPELFFPAGTHFGSGPSGGAYNWSYAVTSVFPAQVWVDSSVNGDGDQPGDGNITG